MLSEAKDMPDGPGIWCGISKQRRFVVWWSEFDRIGNNYLIRWGDDDYCVPYEVDRFERDYQDVKWYKLPLPWEQQPPAPQATLTDFVPDENTVWVSPHDDDYDNDYGG